MLSLLGLRRGERLLRPHWRRGLAALATVELTSQSSTPSSSYQNWQRQRPRRQTDFQRAVYSLDAALRRNGTVQFRLVKTALEQLRPGDAISQVEAAFLLKATGDIAYDARPEERAKLTEQLWKEILPRHGLVPAAPFYNILMQMKIQNGVEFSPSEILAEMEAAGHSANRITFQRIIAQYAQQGNFTAASTVLAQMKDGGMPVTEQTYYALIYGHARNAQVDQAKIFMETLRNARGGTLPVEAWKELVRGCLDGGAEEGAMEALGNMGKADLRLNSTEAVDLYRRAVAGGFSKAAESLRPLLDGQEHSYADKQRLSAALVVRHGMITEALDIIRSMEAEKKDPGWDEHVPSRSLIPALAASKDIPEEEIAKTLHTLADEGLHPEPFRHFRLIAYSSDTALRHLALIIGTKDDPDFRQHYIWPALRQAQLAGRDRLKEALRLCHAQGVKLSEITLGRFVFAGYRNALSLEEVTNDVLSEDAPPAYLVHAAIFGALLRRQPDDARRLLEAHTEAGFPAWLLNELRSADRIFARNLTVTRAGATAAAEAEQIARNAETLCLLVKATGDAARIGPILGVLNQSEGVFTRHIKALIKAADAAGLAVRSGVSDAIGKRMGGMLPLEGHQSLAELAARWEASADAQMRQSSERKQKSQERPGAELLASLESHEEANALRERLAAELEMSEPNSVEWRHKASTLLYVLHKTSQDSSAAEELYRRIPNPTPAESAQLMEMCATEGKAERALELYGELSGVDRRKFTWLLLALARDGQGGRALEVLRELRVEIRDPVTEGGRGESGPVKRLLLALIPQLSLQEMDEFRNLMAKAGLCWNQDNGITVLWHLDKGDGDAAMSAFRESADRGRVVGHMGLYRYNLPRSKDESLTEEERAVAIKNVQEVFDAAETKYGAGNARAELATALVQLNLRDRAARIMKDDKFAPHDRHLAFIFSNIAEGLGANPSKAEEVELLEGWLDAALLRGGWEQKMGTAHREALIMALLKAYRAAGEAAKVAGLWERMEELNMYPSEELTSALMRAMVDMGQPAPKNMDDARRQRMREMEERKESQREAAAAAREARATAAATVSGGADKAILAKLGEGSLEAALEELRRGGARLDRSSFELVAVQAAKANRLDLGLEALEQAFALNKHPRAHAAHQLAYAAVRVKDEAACRRLEDFYQKCGLERDAVSMCHQRLLWEGKAVSVLGDMLARAKNGINYSLFLQAAGEAWPTALQVAQDAGDRNLQSCLWRVAAASPTAEKFAELRKQLGPDSLLRFFPDLMRHLAGAEAVDKIEAWLGADAPKECLARLNTKRLIDLLQAGDEERCSEVFAAAQAKGLALDDLSPTVLRKLAHQLEEKGAPIPLSLHSFFKRTPQPSADELPSDSSSSDEAQPSADELLTESSSSSDEAQPSHDELPSDSSSSSTSDEAQVQAK